MPDYRIVYTRTLLIREYYKVFIEIHIHLLISSVYAFIQVTFPPSSYLAQKE